jgi:hypothetical protein
MRQLQDLLVNPVSGTVEFYDADIASCDTVHMFTITVLWVINPAGQWLLTPADQHGYWLLFVCTVCSGPWSIGPAWWQGAQAGARA